MTDKTKKRDAENTLATNTVLMSVYHRVTFIELDACLTSLAVQSLLPSQFVIVKDGPLNKALDERIMLFGEQFPDLVTVVNLPENLGLAAALNHGLKHCRGEWIIRMDADDISMPLRIETQLKYLAAHTHIDVLGSAMLEFETDPNKPERLKPTVTHHNAIKKQLALRNPINHPTVCIRKQVLEKVGGYPHLPLLEDYFLWVKLMLADAQFANLEQALHLFRFDKKTLARRGGIANFNNECRLRWWMLQGKLISPLRFSLAILLQILLRLMPVQLRQVLWHASRRQVK